MLLYLPSESKWSEMITLNPIRRLSVISRTSKVPSEQPEEVGIISIGSTSSY
jgi:hypothetical protein